jgi:hypothetical protein
LTSSRPAWRASAQAQPRLPGWPAHPYRWQLAHSWHALILIPSAVPRSRTWSALASRPGHPAENGNLSALGRGGCERSSRGLVVNAAAELSALMASPGVSARPPLTGGSTVCSHVQGSSPILRGYASGRIISRLTSDIEALNELLATGDLAITSVLLGGGDHGDPHPPRHALGSLVTLVAMPLVLALTAVVRHNPALVPGACGGDRPVIGITSNRWAASERCMPSGASRATRRSSKTSTRASATPTSGPAAWPRRSARGSSFSGASRLPRSSCSAATWWSRAS